MPLSNGIAIRGDQHAKYWFDDGSVIATIHRTLSNRNSEEDTVLFKLHSSLPVRRSAYFMFWLRSQRPRYRRRGASPSWYPYWLAHIKGERPTWSWRTGERIRVVAGTPIPWYVLYWWLNSSPLPPHSPLSSKSPFSHVASILRVSSPSQLEFPSLHALVRSYLEAIFPSGPLPFMHPDHLEEALALMTAYDIRSPCHNNGLWNRNGELWVAATKQWWSLGCRLWSRFTQGLDWPHHMTECCMV